MKFYQSWTGSVNGTEFPASVPGNIQKDYLEHIQYGDIHYSDRINVFREMEDYTWRYQTKLNFQAKPGEKVYFVSEGIDYICDILLNGSRIYSHEGMFTKIELCLDTYLAETNLLEVVIHPHPKREGAPRFTRDEADHCVKPPVGYGWDWHPRALVSGLWQEAYIETRNEQTITDCRPTYILSEDLTTAEVTFQVSADVEPEIRIFDAEGHVVGTGKHCVLENIRLWWCTGHGEPYLYTWEARTATDVKTGHIGFRRIKLVMNGDAWSKPVGFPMTRSTPPITLNLNGKNIFGKGSNFVTPEIYTACVTDGHYEKLVRLGVENNFNIFRCWGGAGIQKEVFYDLCDRYGMLLWVEFPLACNNYPDEPHYLQILEQEARAIVTKLRSHPSVVLWCGGNELFNSWSGMTDQSKPLRLLNKICYELDQNTPFIAASPLMGMKHGHYMFDVNGRDLFASFQNNDATAYTEFGVPSASSEECLRSIIRPEQLDTIKPGTDWELHHALNAYYESEWLCLKTIQRYFGEELTLGQIVDYSQLLQGQGYKGVFEEARRQSPNCSMAINWDYNEPWKTAANCNIVSYPAEPKASLREIAVSLRDVVASARVPKFLWTEGEVFQAELWMLNDNGREVEDEIEALLQIDGREISLMKWNTGKVTANTLGNTVNYLLPHFEDKLFKLILRSKCGCDNEYLFRYDGKKAEA